MRWVVVGAGAAGGVVASRLSEDPADSIVVVERGPDLTRAMTPEAISGLDLTAALGTDRADDTWRVRRRRDGPEETYLVGRGVGGSGAINGMLMEPGDPEQYRSWGWHDTDGLLDRVLVPTTEASDAVLGPLDRALLEVEPTARRAKLAIRAEQRVTVADAYLDTARARPNVIVHADSPVERIALDGHRATGVVLAGGSMIDADAVVLCAGALASSVILLRSAAWDVPVGEGLQDHPSATVTLRLRPQAHDARSAGGGDPVRPRLATGVVAGDERIQIVPLDHVAPTGGDRHLGAVSAGVLRPRSRGAIRLEPTGEVRIEMNELADPADLGELVKGVERLAALVVHPRLAALIDDSDGHGVTIDEEGTPLASLETADDISAWLTSRPAGGTYLHAAASCPMGEVVDDCGRVFGATNLFVADASVFPSVPAAPTYLPTLMLAERLAPRLRRALADTR